MLKRSLIVALVLIASARLQPLAAQGTPASVSITAPADGARVGGRVTVVATAPAGATVVFRVDGTVIGQDASAPYGVDWNTSDFPVGKHQLLAEVHGSNGSSVTSPAVTVTVERSASADPAPTNGQPTVSITSPAARAEITGTVIVTATAAATVTSVTFRVDGTIIGTDTSAPYSQSWDTRTVPAGTHTLVAEGRDAAGNTRTSSAVPVVVKAENRLPTVTMTAPADGTTQRAPATIKLAATATDPDGSTSRVEFYERSTLLGVDSTEPFTFTWTAPGAGTYRFSARAVDNAGAVGTSSTVTVTVTDGSNPSTVVFEPSLDDRAVVRYVLDIFASGVNPEVGAPSATQNLGKPPIVTGECTAEISETLEKLRPGTYVATVSAVGSSGTGRSAPSPPFVIEAGLLSAISIGRPADDVVVSHPAEREPPPLFSETRTNGLLWVTNPSTSMVAAFDAATGDVQAVIPVGLMPTGLAPAGVGKVYVADQGSDTVSVISKATFNVTATISLPSPGGRKPHHVAASPDGRFVYVGELGANVVDVIDTAIDAVTTSFGAGWPGSTIRGVMPDPSGELVYAVSAGASPSMSTLVALNARTGGWLWHLPITGDANDFALAPDGRTAIVARRDSGTLILIDLERRSVVDELDLGPGNAAEHIHFSADGRLLVITLQQTPDRVGIIDLTKSEAVRVVALGTVPARTSTPEAHRSYVYVSETFTGTAGIVAIDPLSQTLTGRFRFPGGGTPHSAVFDPQ